MYNRTYALRSSSPVKTDEFGRATYRLDLEYDGTSFIGWQIQKEGRSVQGEIEKLLSRLFSDCTRVCAAGRTDAGVHAAAQVAHFRASPHRLPDSVKAALNANLPRDIRIKSVQFAETDFHARFSANWRSYRYRIALEPIAIGREYRWICPYRIVRLADMNQAAEFIIGEHAFHSFSHENEEESHYLSTVYASHWTQYGTDLEYCIEANRFLHGMVRLLVGTFVSVGRGKINAADILTILRERDVRSAGPKAPACGLTLTAVGYHPWPNP